MNRRFDLCEIWDLTFPPHSPRSRLYALEPLGVNTPNVESLTSYMSRLAEAHSVSLRTLVKQELLPRLMQGYLPSPFGSLDAFWIGAGRALNGTGVLAREWTQALEHLTLNTNLQLLTLLPWTAVLTQQRLLRSNRAWCPDCFTESQAMGQPIYEPLLWNVQAVSVCLRHQRALLERCPYPDCHAELPVLASYLRPGYCSKCSRWLGVVTVPGDISRTSDQWPWQVWVAETIGNWLSHNMDLTMTPHLRNIPNLITAVREQVAHGNMQNLARRLQLSHPTLDGWHSGKQTPQLESLLRLCYCCEVSLYEMFTLPCVTFHWGKLKIRPLPDIPNPYRNRRHGIPIDLVSIQQHLEDVLTQEEQPPPSMHTVAKRLNYSPRELRDHFPELSRAISKRRRNYYTVRREQKILRLKEEIRQAILKIHSQGLYPTSHRVGLLLSNPAVMRDRLAVRLWSDMLQELKITGRLAN